MGLDFDYIIRTMQDNDIRTADGLSLIKLYEHEEEGHKKEI